MPSISASNPTYVYTITSLDVYTVHNGIPNVVFQANWSCTGTLDGVSALYYASTPIDPDEPQPPFNELTEADVWGWINPTIDRTQIQTGLYATLVQLNSPVAETIIPPWPGQGVSTVPTLAASRNTAQNIARNVQTAIAFDTVTTNTIQGLEWNAQKIGFVNTTNTPMCLVVGFQSLWAASPNSGIRGDYLRVFNSSGTLLMQYSQQIDSAISNSIDYNSGCSPVTIPPGGYMCSVGLQTSDDVLANGGISGSGTPGTTINAMQLG